jgi:hypothetical protein
MLLKICFKQSNLCRDGFGGLVVRVLALVPELAGSNPAETVGFFCI